MDNTYKLINNYDKDNLLYKDIKNIILNYIGWYKLMQNKSNIIFKKSINKFKYVKMKKNKFKSFYHYRFYRINKKNKINGFYLKYYYR